MYSNFITPPDFVDEDKHTLTIIDASEHEVELITRIVQNANEDFNVYLYRSEMNNEQWLSEAIEKSDSVLVNLDVSDRHELAKNSNTYYCSEKTLLSPAHKIENFMEYFLIRQSANK